MAKLPAIQFYPGDWRKDVGVQSLSFHDRGVWFELLMLMHESEQRGLLLLNGRAMTDEAIGRVLGLDKQTLTTTITNLLDAGVASRDESTGALKSRRMVRDEEIRKTRSEAGFKGGNPALLKQNSTTGDKQNSTPSSSTSASAITTPQPPLQGGSVPKQRPREMRKLAEASVGIAGAEYDSQPDTETVLRYWRGVRDKPIYAREAPQWVKRALDAETVRGGSEQARDGPQPAGSVAA